MGERESAVESLAMKIFGDTYRERHVLVTGHTGFKGSWLSAWLSALGAKVTGLALPPTTEPAHWNLLKVDTDDRRVDVRIADQVAEVVNSTAPEIVFHLAAQSLVRRSYRAPLETWSTNVMGTANVLEACRQQRSVLAIVVITTDKCYENRGWEWSYREIDRLGGHDAYSASKAAVEMVASSYRDAFFNGPGMPLLATARAGNVIGGGDWSEDRLIPDLIRAVTARARLEIRSPNATRPWQHVLEPLSGYLFLGQKLLDGQGEFAQAWNFGPATDSNQSVREVLSRLRAVWPALDWYVTPQPQPHEAHLLHLDSAKAASRLKWHPVWSLDECLEATAEWYRAFLETGAVITQQQLHRYVAEAEAAGLPWAR